MRRSRPAFTLYTLHYTLKQNYEQFLHNSIISSVECVYDAGVVWPSEDGGVFVVQDLASDRRDCLVVGYCVLRI